MNLEFNINLPTSPLICKQEVASGTHLSGDYFTTFLQENYVDFLASVEDLERAADYFSDADYMSALWTAMEELQQYSGTFQIF